MSITRRAVLATLAAFPLAAWATFPQLDSAGAVKAGSSVDATAHTVTLPAVVDADDILMVFAACDSNGGMSTASSGWTEAYEDLGNNSSEMAVYHRDADGTEDGGSMVIDTVGSEKCAWIAVTISGTFDNTVANSVEFGNSVAQDEGTSPDPPALNPTGWDVEDTLWLAVGGNDATGDFPGSYPTNYDSDQLTHDQGSGGGAIVYISSDDVAAASEDPGAYTLIAAEDNNANTIAIRPAAAAATPTIQRRRIMRNLGL